jgi:DNA-binding MarR family transcriptional regulator
MSKTFHLSAFLPYRLAVLAERVSRRLAVEYERTHGLSVAEWRVLVHLQRCGQVSVRDIHNCVNLEKPRVSRAVSRLESLGMVQKEGGQGDGRLVRISLTKAGSAALAEIIPIATGIEARLMAGLAPEEAETFIAVMEKIHATLDADPKAKARSRRDLEAAEG